MKEEDILHSWLRKCSKVWNVYTNVSVLNIQIKERAILDALAV